MDKGRSKKTQKEILEMRDKFHLLYRLAPISYFDFEQEEVIIKACPQAAELLKAERWQNKLIEEYTVELEHKQIELENLYHQLDQEVNQASKIHQRNINNKMPDLDNYYFGSYYQPAAKMGGDFYETIKIGNKLVCYISDVTGHGLDAAMMSCFIKSTVKSFINAVELTKINPGDIIKFLAEQFLEENYPEDYFICITLIVIDLKTNLMEYSSMGIQDPILLYRQNKDELIKLVNKGLPISPVLGVEFFDFESNSIKLQPGDTVLFNTDGITEARNKGEYFLDSFQQLFKENAFLPPAVISRRIINEFCKFNNNSLQSRDDITYLILKRKDQKSKIYNFEIKSTNQAVSKLQSKIYKILPNSVSNDIFAMGLHELVVNAVEHGNQMQAGKKVYIELFVNDNYTYAVIEDQGKGFNWKQKLNQDFNIEQKNDRGRGIMMTARGCNDFFYNKKGNKAYILKLNDF